MKPGLEAAVKVYANRMEVAAAYEDGMAGDYRAPYLPQPWVRALGIPRPTTEQIRKARQDVIDAALRAEGYDR